MMVMLGRGGACCQLSRFLCQLQRVLNRARVGWVRTAYCSRESHWRYFD